MIAIAGRAAERATERGDARPDARDARAMRLGRIAALLLALTALGCGPTYRFTPPATPMGQACTTQCQMASDQCRMMKDQEYQQCQWRRDMAQRAYDQCKATTDDAFKCSASSVPLCYMANYSPCDERFRTCYEACGGTVTEVQPQ